MQSLILLHLQTAYDCSDMTKTSYPKTVLILGASGLVGSALFATLRDRGVSVTGTAREEREGLLALNTAEPGNIESFPWEKFNTIIDCTGVIQYDSTLSALDANIRGNVRIPRTIIKQLGSSQRYFYCSTHAVLAPENKRTTYAISKALFEESIRREKGLSAMVTIVRLPAIFSERRDSGLVHRITDRD